MFKLKLLIFNLLNKTALTQQFKKKRYIPPDITFQQLQVKERVKTIEVNSMGNG